MPGSPPAADSPGLPVDGNDASSDRAAWLSMGKKVETEAEKTIRLEMERRMKSGAADYEQLMQKQLATARKDATTYWEGDLMKMTWRRVFGLRRDLVVMCSTPLPSISLRAGLVNKSSVGGGGCRIAPLGKEWAGATTAEEAQAMTAATQAAVATAAKDGSVPELFNEINWGSLQPFLHEDQPADRVEVERISDDRLLVCFQLHGGKTVSCRQGVVTENSSLQEFSAPLDAGAGLLTAVATNSAGSGFSVCIQALQKEGENSSAAAQISCRWGQVGRTAQDTTLMWLEEKTEFKFE